MTQNEQVIDVLRQNGGFATLGFLNQYVDVSNWKTKTPFASIRRIVQQQDEIFKIKPGLWALKEFKDKLPDNIFPKQVINEEKNNELNHSYFQGLLLEIGNYKKFLTYIPNQDKNKLFLEKKLSDIASLNEFYDFTYPEVIRYAKTIDVIWFNERKLPSAFFEVEHTTDIKNSLTKFVELQDFHSHFFIVSAKAREREFNDKIQMTSFKDINKRVEFIDYEKLSLLHSKTLELFNIGISNVFEN